MKSSVTSNYKIVEASVDWADRFREFCRQVYQKSYPRPELGITKDLFSKEIFASPRIKSYFTYKCTPTAEQKCWLALDAEGVILGVVAAHRYNEYCEMQSFYVSPECQGQGIGHALYEKVLEFAGKLPIQVDVVEYMQTTIDMYKHWGFEVDTNKGKLKYGVPE
jgi:ribosomal protein S18 acetylase RimI-like enzyme